jgi:hypothetical protein
VYHVPFVDFWRIFEMPLLGYGGYLVFAWELFALYGLVSIFAKRRDADSFLRIVADAPGPRFGEP